MCARTPTTRKSKASIGRVPTHQPADPPVVRGRGKKANVVDLLDGGEISTGNNIQVFAKESDDDLRMQVLKLKQQLATTQQRGNGLNLERKLMCELHNEIHYSIFTIDRCLSCVSIVY